MLSDRKCTHSTHVQLGGILRGSVGRVAASGETGWREGLVILIIVCGGELREVSVTAAHTVRVTVRHSMLCNTRRHLLHSYLICLIKNEATVEKFTKKSSPVRFFSVKL